MKESAEVVHSRQLAKGDPASVWGWASPAGKVRAARRANLIISSVDMKPGMRVLELGCGNGVFTEFFAASGAEIVALDISPELIELARKRCNDKKVTFLVSPVEELTLSERFDAVVGSSVLHHLDLGKALPLVYAHLEPRGSSCFAEPNMLNPQIFMQKNIPWLKKKLGDTPDETAFYRWSLKRKLEQAGFREIKITPFDWLHPLIPEVFIPLVGKLGHALEKMPLLKEFAGSLLIQSKKI